MKKIISFLIIFSLLFRVYGKEHSLYTYKATIKNDSNIIVSDRIVNVKLSILKGSFSGEPIYIEQQTTKSNEDGEIHLEIGNGIVEKGNFSLIDLSSGNFWLQTEIDPLGGTNYLTPVVQEMEENEHEYGHIDLNSGNFFKTLIRDLFNSWSVGILLILSLGIFLFVKFKLWNLFSTKPRRSYRFVNLETKNNISSQINSNYDIPVSNKNSDLDTNINLPQTNFFQDLITGENLTNTRSFLMYLSSCIILFFWGRYIFETTDLKGDGNDLLAIIIHLILIIISIIMMLASPILLIVSLNYSSSISELFYYNRNKRIAQEEVVMNEKKNMEYAIQIKERTENFKLKIAKIEQLRKVNWDNLTTSEKEQALIIKNPITGDKLRVASKNFSKMMDYQQAMIECRALGNGWRLPTIEELKEMDLHLYQKGLGDFITYDNIQKVHYHSAYSDYNYDNSSIQYSFFLGQTLSSGFRIAWVRVVKSI